MTFFLEKIFKKFLFSKKKNVIKKIDEVFFRKCYIIGILCSRSLGVGNRVSKSDRPFVGKKEEEGSLRWDFMHYIFSFRMGGGGFVI